MRRFTGRRSIGVVVVFALLSGVNVLSPWVLADEVPCYHAIKEVPCPTVTMSDSCATQYKNAGGKADYQPHQASPICNDKGEHVRTSGYYGEECCWAPGGQTGHKCRPKTAGTPPVIQKKTCGYKYKCKWNGTAYGCLIDYSQEISSHEAELYELVPDGCKALPPDPQ